MSAFLNDSQLVPEGLLDSGLADLSPEQPVAYGLADRADATVTNTLDKPSVELPELDTSENSSKPIGSARPLVPPTLPQPSAPIPKLDSDSLVGSAAEAGRQIEDVAFDITSGISVSGSATQSGVATAAANASENLTAALKIQTQATKGEKIVQAEDYRQGRNGVTYFDTTSGNQGGQYRKDGVDIQRTSDSGGGYNVGWTRPGEWLTYDLALESGTYDVVIRASSKWQGGRLKLSAGGSSDEIQIGKTRDWQTFQDFTLKGFQVTGSQNTFRLDALSGGFNLNYIKFIPSSTIPSPSPPSTSASGERFRVEAEDYSSYYDTTQQNIGGAYRQDGVDIRKTLDSGGGFTVVENRPGEWLSYNVSPEAGTYDVVVRASSRNRGGRIQLSVGDTRTQLKISSTKGLGRYRNFVAKGVEIGADTSSFRLDIVSGYMHLNFIDFIPRNTDGGSPPAPGGNGGAQGGGGSDGGGQGSGSEPGMGPLPTTSFDRTYGYGLVDAASAVSYAIDSPITAAPNTNSGSNSASLNTMNVPDVWKAGFTGQGKTVAILDTGVDIRHRDLAANTWKNGGEVAGDGLDNDGNGYVDDINGFNFVNANGNVIDDNGHGTHLAGIVAGVQNSFGITGVAHNATLMPVKILDRDGLGTFDDIVNGIRYAVDNGADVINLSLGVDFSQSSLRNAIKYAYDKGVVVVSAAGNGGDNQPFFPAQYANQYGLAVGTVDASNQYQSYSNRAGSNSLDYIVAPGHRISSTAPDGGIVSKSGTSMSTAHISGVAALIRSAKPSLSAEKVEELIVKTANSQLVQV